MNRKLTTKDVTSIALLTAMSVALKFFSINIGDTIRFSFLLLPVMIAGIFYGPLVGGITGGIGDLIGHLAFPQGAFHPGFTLTGIVVGVSAALISQKIFKSKISTNRLALSLSVSVFCFMIVALFLNTLWLSQITGTSYWPLFKLRIPKSLIEMAINWIVLYLILPRLNQVLK